MKIRNGSLTIWLVCGLYLAIMVESATVGLLFHATLSQIMDQSELKVEHRHPPVVITLTFAVVALIGYILTLPSLCFAVHKYSSSALVPYLVWRMIFCIIVGFIIVWQALQRPDAPVLFQTAFYNHQLSVALAEVILGLVFFLIAYRSYHDFELLHILRIKDRTPEVIDFT